MHTTENKQWAAQTSNSESGTCEVPGHRSQGWNVNKIVYFRIKTVCLNEVDGFCIRLSDPALVNAIIAMLLSGQSFSGDDNILKRDPFVKTHTCCL